MKKKQRIRYIEKDGKLISGEIISKHNAKYIVVIDLSTMTYLIRNTLSLRKYCGGEGINNLHVLKRKVKKHLEHLGCEFSSEKRFRSFGLCESGYNMQIHLQKMKEDANLQKQEDN